MSKTPYEVRLDVLKMAQEMLDKEISLQQHHQTMDNSLAIANQAWNYTSRTPINMYTTSEVIAKADELYRFVSSSNSTISSSSARTK